jgi:hypothetical protein
MFKKHRRKAAFGMGRARGPQAAPEADDCWQTKQNPPAGDDERPGTRARGDGGRRDNSGGRLIELPIEQELKDSYARRTR